VESTVDINPANYALSWGDSIEITVDGSGDNGDAESLSVGCVFVLQ
jgi:hypothetical protein